MSAPYGTAISEGRRLKAEADAAAEVRNWQTDPNVVALGVERVRKAADRLIWAGIVICLLFTMVTVQVFAARGAATYSLSWWAAWFLDPAVTVGLLGVLLAEGTTSRWQVVMAPRTRVTKCVLLAATYVMNTWPAWADRDPAGVVLHSVPPLVVFLLSECRTDVQDKLTETVYAAHNAATERAARKAKDSRDVEVSPLGDVTEKAPPPVLPAVRPAVDPPIGPVFNPTRPDSGPSTRPDPATAVRPDPADPGSPVIDPRADPVSARRPDTAARVPGAGKRTTKPKTDEQLVDAARKARAETGNPPTVYQLRQEFGVGATRAARLLAELGTTTPAGDPATNGTARREGAR